MFSWRNMQHIRTQRSYLKRHPAGFSCFTWWCSHIHCVNTSQIDWVNDDRSTSRDRSGTALGGLELFPGSKYKWALFLLWSAGPFEQVKQKKVCCSPAWSPWAKNSSKHLSAHAFVTDHSRAGFDLEQFLLIHRHDRPWSVPTCHC